jgi:perosamine synthetase
MSHSSTPSHQGEPALLGGTPLRPQGPPHWPLRDERIRYALQMAYDTGSWGMYFGDGVDALEEQLGVFHNVPFALTCSSGTLAVELALRALNLGAGDKVLLAAYDYPGNFLTVHALGARPVLVDLDPDNGNLSLARVAEALDASAAEVRGGIETGSVRTVIASHLHGGLIPMRELTALCQEHEVAVIEDAAQVTGATVQGKPAGSWGDIGVLSFGGSKLLSAGRGGALLTGRAEVHQRLRLLMVRGPDHLYRLSELQAAVLLPQLEQLPQRHAQRLRNARWLADRLGAVPGIRPWTNPPAVGEPGYYKMGFWLDEQAFGLSRSLCTRAARAEGIALDAGFRALHVGRSPKRYRAAGPLPVATRAHSSTVVLHHPILLGTEEDLEQVACAVEKIHTHAEALRRGFTAEGAEKREEDSLRRAR